MQQQHLRFKVDWQKAQIHGRASKIGYINEEDQEVCDCCHNHVSKEEIPLCDDPKRLHFLGFGIPIIFVFLKSCLMLLFLLIISNNFVTLFLSIHHGQVHCQKHRDLKQSHHSQVHHLISNQITSAHYSGHHKVNPLDRKCENIFLMWAEIEDIHFQAETILRICNIMAMFAGLFMIKKEVSTILANYDERQSDISDFSVLVKNIDPNQTSIRKNWKSFFEQYTYDTDKKYNIHQIDLLPQHQQLLDIVDQQQKVKKKFVEAKYGQKQQNPEKINEIYENILKKQLQKFNQVQKLLAKISEDNIGSEDIIIIFETQPEKKHFLDHFEEIKNSKAFEASFKQRCSNVVAMHAPQPRQLNYQNLKDNNHKRKRIFKGWSLFLLFLIISLLIFYIIQYIKTLFLQKSQKIQHQNPSLSSLFSTLSAIVFIIALVGVIMFNKLVMGSVAHYLSDMQRHQDKTNESFSFAFKYALGTFFIAAFMTILVEAFTFKNFYQEQYGVIESETIIFILMVTLKPITQFIDPHSIKVESKRKNNYGRLDMTQKQANKLMEGYPYDSGKRYGQILKLMWFAFLYADIIPIGAFLIFISIVMHHWIDKYTLLRKSSLKEQISGGLAIKCLRLMDLTIIWKYLGQIIFDFYIKGSPNKLSGIFLVLCVVYFFIPWYKILGFVGQTDFRLNDKSFTEEKKKFKFINYSLCHPSYKEILCYVKNKNKNADTYERISGRGRQLYLRAEQDMEESRKIEREFLEKIIKMYNPKFESNF